MTQISSNPEFQVISNHMSQINSNVKQQKLIVFCGFQMNIILLFHKH